MKGRLEIYTRWQTTAIRKYTENQINRMLREIFPGMASGAMYL